MKKIYFFILMLYSTSALMAQTTDAINYQAVIRNSSGQLLVNTTVGVQVSILQGSAQGTVSYVETHTVSTNANGLMSFPIGTGAAATGTYASIDWSLKPYYVSIALDLTSGNSYMPYSTTGLHSVPYALQAKKADVLTNPLEAGAGISITDNNVSIADGKTINNVKVWDGSSWVNKAVSVSSGTVGNGQAFNHRDPYLGLSYQIALRGIYPSRNGADPFVGEIMLFAGSYAVNGYALCEGQLLLIQAYQLLYTVLGTTYGGDGVTTFALPDLRSRTPVHAGQGPGLSPIQLGEKSGSENVTLTIPNLPAHEHTTTVTFPAP